MNNNNTKVLVIGPVKEMVPESDALDQTGYDIYGNTLDGVYAASTETYDAIVLVKTETGARFESVIQALRSHNDAPLYVLAHMTDEPELRARIDQPNALNIEDYLIGPISRDHFERMLWTESESKHVEQSHHDQKQRIAELEKLATEDDLTGLKNRRYIWEFARQIIEYAHKQAGRVTLMVYDIDDFKHYNDCYGHPIGDTILKEAAVLMRSCCRAHDVVGRIGGDEFAVIFWDDPQDKQNTVQERRLERMEHPREPIFIAKRFQQALEHADINLLGPDGKGVLTISGGLASFPQDGDTVEQLFDRADQALLEAKRSGKNRVYLVGSEQNNIAHWE